MHMRVQLISVTNNAGRSSLYANCPLECAARRYVQSNLGFAYSARAHTRGALVACNCDRHWPRAFVFAAKLQQQQQQPLDSIQFNSIVLCCAVCAQL